MIHKEEGFMLIFVFMYYTMWLVRFQIAKKMLTNTLLAPLNISLVFTPIILLQGHSPIHFLGTRCQRLPLWISLFNTKKDRNTLFFIGYCLSMSIYWPRSSKKYKRHCELLFFSVSRLMEENIDHRPVKRPKITHEQSKI